MKKLKTILCGAVAAGVIAVGIAPFIWAKQDAVIPGMRLNGQNVGGMTREDLSQLLKKKNQDLTHKKNPAQSRQCKRRVADGRFKSTL